MTNHFIKTFIAYVKNNLLSYLIGIIGISVGIACISIVLLYSSNEFGFNKMYSNHDNIFRVVLKDNKQDKIIVGTPALLYNLFTTHLEDTILTSQLGYIKDVKLIDSHENANAVENVITASSELLRILNIEMNSGVQRNILDDPGAVMVSESFSKKYYPHQDLVGEIINLRIGEKDHVFTVKSIFKDFPVNSSFAPNIICNRAIKLDNLIASFDQQTVLDSWLLKAFITYIYIPFNTDINLTEARLNRIIKESFDNKYSVKLQKFSDLYFEYGESVGGKHGNKQIIYTVLAIGILVLVIGVINYIILSMAQSAKRSKEYGVRQILGAQKFQLRGQIVLESLILSCFSLPIAFLIFKFLLPIISNLLNIDLGLFLKQNPVFYLYSVLITIITGLIIGCLISLRITRVSIMDLISNQKLIHGKQRKISIHYQLMILELIIFIALANISINIFRQINYSKNIDLGFAKENLLKIYIDDDEFQASNYRTYLDAIKKDPGIVSVSGAAVSPGSDDEMILQAYNNSNFSEEGVRVNYMPVDFNFCSTMEIPILNGRSFTDEYESNYDNKIIVNKAFIDYFSIKNPIGSNIWLDWFGQKVNKEIIGVSDNFFMHSTRDEIMPCVIELNPLFCYEYLIRYNPKNSKVMIPFLVKKWNEMSSISNFHYEYFDQIVDNFYMKEKKQNLLINLFFLITIVLLIVGLYATSIYTLEQKQIHIGIMKVFGAGKRHVFNLFVRDFFLAIIIASFISIPIVKYLLSLWLQNFKYQINNTIWYLLLGPVIAILVVFFTIILNAIKSTKINPIEIIKHE